MKCPYKITCRRGITERTCKAEARYEFNGIHYCANHYPPNREKRVMARRVGNKRVRNATQAGSPSVDV